MHKQGGGVLRRAVPRRPFKHAGRTCGDACGCCLNLFVDAEACLPEGGRFSLMRRVLVCGSRKIRIFWDASFLAGGAVGARSRRFLPFASGRSSFTPKTKNSNMWSALIAVAVFCDHTPQFCATNPTPIPLRRKPGRYLSCPARSPKLLRIVCLLRTGRRSRWGCSGCSYRRR